MWRRVIAVFLTLVAILAAGWLALRRGDIPYDTLELAYSVPNSEFVTLDNGMKLHFTDTGPRDHPVIVLVHGFSASLHTWEAWKEDLEDDYRVITLDLPGRCRSIVFSLGLYAKSSTTSEEPTCLRSAASPWLEVRWAGPSRGRLHWRRLTAFRGWS